MTAGSAFLVRAWCDGAWWLHLLRPLEWLYRGVVSLRRAGYRRGLLSVFRPDKPVVVVGNISLGGTGKTPVVIALVEALHQHGIRAGVVCRGYGASTRNFPHALDENSNPAQCGDEAVLIYTRTGCPCVAAPSRIAAVQTLLRDFSVDVIICDDGLQHYALDRDFEIAMYDAQSGFGNGRCLPAGPLREPLHRLDAVDFVLGRGSASMSNGVCYHIDGLINLQSGERRDASPADLAREVYAVAGIGQPKQFFSSLRAQGFNLDTRTFPDHHRYRAADFAALTDKPVIMTEKDAVKCRALVGDDAWYLRISITLPETVTAAVVSLVKR